MLDRGISWRIFVIKKWMLKWQEIPLVILAFSLFFGMQWLLPILDPTAGTYDAGYLHKPITAAVWLIWGNAVVWTIGTISFKTFSKYIDDGSFSRHFNNAYGDSYKVKLVLFMYAFQMIAYLVCLWLVPL
jgi:hypothetical protein